MIMLNSRKGFSWAQFISPSDGLALARVAFDSFYILGCSPYATEGKTGFVGKIAGNLSKCEVHGLKPNEEVFFTPTR